jgi:DNA-binding transcriptional ArsR family regulator
MQGMTLDLGQMQATAQEVCTLMKVLSNPDRLLILCRLSEGEQSVGELEAALGIVQPTLSQQLTVLRHESLVVTRRDGKHVFYRLAGGPVMAVMQVLFEQFCQPRRSRIPKEKRA